MQKLTQAILEHVARLPEGATVSAKALLHLGSRAAVDQSLSRLVRRGQLIRAGRGLYVHPVESRFGKRPPSVAHVVQALAASTDEVIASHGAAAANALGLTTQVPVREVYLTSGPSRRLKLGAKSVELRHAPKWQLTLAGRPSGEAIRALAWLGEAHAPAALKTLSHRLSTEALAEIVHARPRLPTWLAQQVSGLAVNG
ncbi:DUF6088 family protein [Caulobacter sp.]|uniref:DUF6088 family protein n=1 Tax=Caulobacter sp. TaxID=78 RepID=UPI00161BD821